VYFLVFHAYFLLGILIFKGLTAWRLYKSFSVKGLNEEIVSSMHIFKKSVLHKSVMLHGHRFVQKTDLRQTNNETNKEIEHSLIITYLFRLVRIFHTLLHLYKKHFSEGYTSHYFRLRHNQTKSLRAVE
jgi:hypothetical protein